MKIFGVGVLRVLAELYTDNAKAAEMTTANLSLRQELVEGLQADGVMDYLSFHGVLDPGVLAGLDEKATNTQINTILLRHIERHGNTAVTFLIDALRRSWQLQLANYLDTEQKIRPTSGNSYLGKERMKGEITIRIEIEALHLLVPADSQPVKTLRKSPLELPAKPIRRRIIDADADVFVRDHADGVFVKDVVDGVPVRDDAYSVFVKDVVDGAPVRDDADDEDFVKPRSCWCFCMSRKSKSRSKSKKEMKEQKKTKAHKAELHQTSSPDSCPEPTLKADNNNPITKPHRRKLSEKSKDVKGCVTESVLSKTFENNNTLVKGKNSNKKSRSFKPKSKTAEKYSVPDTTDGPAANQTQEFRNMPQADVRSELDLIPNRVIKIESGAEGFRIEEFDTLSGREKSRLKNREYLHDIQHSSSEITNKPSHRTWDQTVDKDMKSYSSVHYNPKLKMVKLGDGQTELDLPKKQFSNNDLMHEQWTCQGKAFHEKASELCERVSQELRNEIIKYFELVRGILVWDVVPSGSTLNVVSICMQQSHVVCLQQDLIDGSLLSRMQYIFSKVNMFDIKGMKLRTVMDDRELNLTLQELSS